MWGQSLNVEKGTKSQTDKEVLLTLRTADVLSSPLAVFKGKPPFRATVLGISSSGRMHLLIALRTAAK